MHFVIQAKEHGFTGCNIPNQFKPEHIQCDALRCCDIFRPVFCLALAEYKRAYSTGVTKCQDTIPGNHGNGGIGATTAAVYPGNGIKYIVNVYLRFALLLQLVGKNVQQYLGI